MVLILLFCTHAVVLRLEVGLIFHKVLVLLLVLEDLFVSELLGLYVLVQGVIEFLTVYVFDMLFYDLADEFC